MVRQRTSPSTARIVMLGLLIFIGMTWVCSTSVALAFWYGNLAPADRRDPIGAFRRTSMTDILTGFYADTLATHPEGTPISAASGTPTAAPPTAVAIVEVTREVTREVVAQAQATGPETPERPVRKLTPESAVIVSAVIGAIGAIIAAVITARATQRAANRP